jgi:hypothetical protein
MQWGTITWLGVVGMALGVAVAAWMRSHDFGWIASLSAAVVPLLIISVLFVRFMAKPLGCLSALVIMICTSVGLILNGFGIINAIIWGAVAAALTTLLAGIFWRWCWTRKGNFDPSEHHDYQGRKH